TDIRAVGIYGTGPTYLLIGTTTGLAYSNNGGSTFTDITGNLMAGNSVFSGGVAFFDGTNLVAVTRDMGGAGPNGSINVCSGDPTVAGNWTAYDVAHAQITDDDYLGVDIYRGPSPTSMQWILIGTTADGVMRCDLTGPTFTTYDQAGSALPDDVVTSASFDQGSAAGAIRALVGTTTGGAQATSLQGSPTWTTITAGLPSQFIWDCAYGTADSSGNYFMFATAGGIAYTTNGWTSRTIINRSTAPYIPRNEAFTCAYFNGAAAGDRMLWGCRANNLPDAGGVVLRAGSQYETSGSITIPQCDGLLLPNSGTVPSVPDRNITGVCYHNGTNNANDFVVSTLYGTALTTDGGVSFTALQAPSTPAANALPSSLISCVAFFKGSSTAMLVGTFGQGAALTTNGGSTWTVLNAGMATNPLPSNNVQWVAFHDGVGNPDTYLICTDAGTYYVSGGTYVGIFDNTHTSNMDDNQTCADFDDSDTTSPYTFIVCAREFNTGVAGAFRTVNDGGAFQRFNFNNPPSLPSSWMASCAYFNNTTFLLGADNLTGAMGAASLTVNTGGFFDSYDATNGGGNLDLYTNNVRLVAICDQTANPTHWMAYNVRPNSGLCVTTNGDQGVGTTTFTRYDSGTTPALPSDNVLSCAYWNGTGATGATWSVGTTAGFVQTTNGGGNLAGLGQTVTGYSQLVVTETTPANTNITYDILDSGGTPITGFTNLTPSGGAIDISGINFGTYSVIQVRANLTTTNTSVTPVLHDIKIYFTY
ncbi:MAG: hypothetical protein ACYS47_20930, partial [Planctomycetota bacterium]